MDSARWKKRKDQSRSSRRRGRGRKLTLLNVVIRKGSTVLELLSGKDKSLLVRRNTLLVLDLGLNVVDGIGRLDLEGDGLSSQARKEKERGRSAKGLDASRSREERKERELTSSRRSAYLLGVGERDEG